MNESNSVNVGIITALPEEFTAACEVLHCDANRDLPGQGAGRKYKIGRLATKEGGEHVVAVALLDEVGNNSAAVRATQMTQHFPKLEHIVMVGIAGAVPNPDKPKDHVRLGDIVVSDRNGVIQYDHVKRHSTFSEHRPPPRPPGAALTEATKWLIAGEMRQERPWNAYITQGILKLGPDWKRPSQSFDKLQDELSSTLTIPHPRDSERIRGQPRVFHGTIASANTLLKDPKYRDALRDIFNVKAVEMEGSGISDASWTSGNGYLVVRGTCDYCNSTKGDKWHKYAALVAAAYARCVVEALAPRAQEPLAARPETAVELGASPVQKTKRSRDVQQLRRVLYWLNLRVMDRFIDRLGFSRITLIGGDFFEGLERVVLGSAFSLHDKQLEGCIRVFTSSWAACFKYTGMMDEHPNEQEAHFRLPMDCPTSEAQSEAHAYTAKTAQPLRTALDSLLTYIRTNYLEINTANIGAKALAEYLKERKKT